MHLQTEKDVLQSVRGSTLSKLFSDMHELKIIDDEVFLDRDGKTFEALVNYLRNDRKVSFVTEKSSQNSQIKTWKIISTRNFTIGELIGSIDSGRRTISEDLTDMAK